MQVVLPKEMCHVRPDRAVADASPLELAVVDVFRLSLPFGTVIDGVARFSPIEKSEEAKNDLDCTPYFVSLEGMR